MVSRFEELKQRVWYYLLSFDPNTVTTQEERDLGIYYTVLERFLLWTSLLLVGGSVMVLWFIDNISSIEFSVVCAATFLGCAFTLSIVLSSRDRRIRELLSKEG